MPTQVPLLTAPSGYRPQAEDTGAEADLLCFYLLRQKTVTERLEIGAQLMRSAHQFSINCFQQRFAHLSPRQLARKLAEAWLQEHCPSGYIPGGSPVSWIQDSIQLAAELHTIFGAKGIAYYVTGGVAAIAYGESRTTQDLDVVLAIAREDVPPLAAALEAAGFYVPGVDDVIAGRMQTLQVTQIDTISRADLVIAEDAPYEQLKFERRQAYPLPSGTTIYLASPEDLVVNKLRWGQGSQSQKQWRDVLGVLKAQQESLDYQYMHTQAAELDLSAALEQATLEAGVRAIADQQWAAATYPVAVRAFELAQERNRTNQVAGGVERADGNDYCLTRDVNVQMLTIIAKLGDYEVVRYSLSGEILSAGPSLKDRQRWREVARRLP